MWYCPGCGAQNQDPLGACFNCGAVWQNDAATPSRAGRGEYIPYPSYPAAYPPAAYPTPYPLVVQAPVLGGFWVRYAAFLIDNAIVQLVMTPVSLLFFFLIIPNRDFGSGRGFPAGFWLFYALQLLLYLGLLWGYNIFMLGRYQATLGKKALGLVVVRTDAQPLDYKTIVIRETIGKTLSMIPCNLGYIWAGFDQRRQAWHDKLARTYVYRIK